MRRLDYVLGAFVLFYGAFFMCLPVPWSEEVAQQYPWWATRIEIGKVVVHELVFLVWIAVYGLPFLSRGVLDRSIPARRAALWLIALAFWCGLVSLTAPSLVQDIGRTFRLLLNAALLLAVVRWTVQADNLTARILVLGFLTGTLVNLLMSFQYPLIVNATMRLAGQNTPGVAMGLAIHVCAWLFLRERRRLAKVFAMAGTPIFVFACALSYSRIGWFTAASGLAAWAYVLLLARPVDPAERKSLKATRPILVLVVGVALALGSTTIFVQDALGTLVMLLEKKASDQIESNNMRLAYVFGTVEILSSRPLGVGYSGFYDAMTSTEAYLRGGAAEEGSSTEANPHATFLWYATAGGIPGGVLALVVFALLLRSLQAGLAGDMGRDGNVLFALVASPFFVMALTVPYLFSSVILIVPAGIVAGWAQSRDWATSPRLRTDPASH